MSAYVQTVVGSDSAPVGAIMDFPGPVEPSGWIFCFGQELPRVGLFNPLFMALGGLSSPWGLGNGTTTFNVPDFRGRTRAGKDNMGGVAANRLVSRVNGNVLGASGGAESHTLVSSELANHTHSYLRQAGVSGGWNFTSGAILATQTSDVTGDVTGGSGLSHNNVQPTGVVNVIIKYTVSGTVLPIVPGTGDVTGPDGGVADGQLAVFFGTSGKVIRGGSLFPRNHLAGLTIANNVIDATNDIDISEGECRDSTNSADIKLSALITKRLDANWAVGSNQGGLDTGAIADGTYHVFAIKRVDTGVCDVLFSISPSAPTLPANYTVFRRVGSILRVGATIKPFLQTGDTFQIAKVNNYVSGTARALALQALSVPTGITVLPILALQLAMSGNGSWTMQLAPGANSSLLVNSVVQTNLANAIDSAMVDYIASNTSAQVYLAVINGGGTISQAALSTLGWIDDRGQNN